MATTQNLAKQLDFLYQLSQIMNQVTDLSKALDRALALMAKDLKIMRGTITLISPETGEIRIHAAYGLNACELARGHYQRGEGITGRVIETGRPMYIDNVSNEPLFLNKTKSRDLKKENISFICVPIELNQEIVGALSIDQPRQLNHSLENETKLLQIIASILAHAAIESQRKMDEQNQSKLRPKGIIGNSSEMQNVYQLINQVADSMATVLLVGESGTGKELIARAIHDQSPRAQKPFISLNCAALPESLIESELFGHEKGAFSGAGYTRKGRFEMAHGGTLFLDEIGEMSLVMQAKMLRVLQSLTFERLGGMETHKVDVRLICATNRDLTQMVADATFRRDLYFRINVFPIFLPPLRERKSDILSLSNYFLKKFSPSNSPIRLSYATMDLLENYCWPGNVRELENVLERAVLLLGQGSLILPVHLPKEVQEGSINVTNDNTQVITQNLKEQLEEIEKNALIDALTNTNGHIGAAAHTLGYTERMMNLRMKKYNLNFKTFRQANSN